MVHIPENSQNTLVPYPAYNFPVQTKSDDSFATILTNSELYCTTPHAPSSLSLSTPSAKANTPPTQLLRSAGYTHSVASSLVHPPGKHLRSTTSSISTPHDTNSTQDSTHSYIAILTKYLLVYLLVCMFACSCCIVIGAFVPSREGRIYSLRQTVEPEASFASSHPFAGVGVSRPGGP